MNDDEILHQSKAIVNLYEMGDEDKMHDAIEGMRLIAQKDAVADVPCNVGLCGIPLLRGKPEITNNMKRKCHGEFIMEIEETCTACFYDEPQEDCEVCAGEVTYIRSVEVPWTMVKDIYKRMAIVAMEPA